MATEAFLSAMKLWKFQTQVDKGEIKKHGIVSLKKGYHKAKPR